MQLNELIEQEGIEKVAIKTTISQDNLNYLINENFEKLSRVKALGFLLILEREYKELEVSELRENIKLFFENNHPDYDNLIVVSRSSSTHKSGEFSFFKWFVILGILVGGWYLYTQGKLDGLLQNITNKKDIYTNEKALENNTTEEEAEKISITKDTQEPVSIVAPVEPKIDLEAATVNVVAEENRTEKTVNKTETMQSSVAKELTKIKASQPLLSNGEAAENKPEVKSVPVISTITINPTRGMLWFGFINVDTKKKKEFMKQVSTPFDIKDGRWILVTGHGFLDIASEAKTLEVSDRNKHYFYIDSKEIKEISQKEFRELNGGHGWI